MGKAIRDARAEAGRAVSILRYHAADALQPSGATYPSAEPDTLLMTISEPVGVVCAITPWNFPLAIPAWKLAPALARAGNAVVWKPAAAASGSALLLAEVLAEAELPPGVLNVVTGSGAALSESLTSDTSLAALTFTGSVEVGNGVQSAAVARGAKVQLELGGKNPAVVLADADLGRAAESVAAGAMLATGQRCTATSRVYVQSAAYERFVSLLVERVEALRVGDPYDESTDVGPLAFAERLQAVRAYLEMAHEGGAAILAGGTAGDPADGYYVAPTVLAEVPTDSPLLREEIFGPVVVVAPGARSRRRDRGCQRHAVRALGVAVQQRPRQRADLRPADRVGTGPHQPRDGRRRAPCPVRRDEGVEQPPARAGQGGAPVLHELEDRLREAAFTALDGRRTPRRSQRALAPFRRHGRGRWRALRARSGRGGLGLGRGRPPLPRRERQPLVPEPRPRAPRDRGGRRRSAAGSTPSMSSAATRTGPRSSSPIGSPRWPRSPEPGCSSGPEAAT